jgi:hypothetical protein
MARVRRLGLISALILAAMAAMPAAGCSSSSGGTVHFGNPVDSGAADVFEAAVGGGDGPSLGPDAPPGTDDAGATSTCAAFASYSMCNVTDQCAPMYAQDCDAFDALYSSVGRAALTSCYGSASACGPNADVGDCLFKAAVAATPDSAAQALATAFCNACPTGSSTCPTDFYSASGPETGVIGFGLSLQLSLMTDATLQQINMICVTGLSADAGTSVDAGSSLDAGGDAGESMSCSDIFATCAASLTTPTECNPNGDAGPDADPGGA